MLNKLLLLNTKYCHYKHVVNAWKKLCFKQKFNIGIMMFSSHSKWIPYLLLLSFR